MSQQPKAQPQARGRPIPPTPRRHAEGRKTLVRAIVLLIALAAVAAGSFYAWKYFSAYESTDDAEVDGNINAISARINGYVLDVPVDDERYVKAGDVLARIDPKDYQRRARSSARRTWPPPRRAFKAPVPMCRLLRPPPTAS